MNEASIHGYVPALPLPEGWVTAIGAGGAPCYVNRETGESTMDRCANPECQAPFVAKSGQQRVCSRACRKAEENRARREDRGFDKSPRACAYEPCGKTFVPKKKKQIFCSRTCCRRHIDKVGALPERPCPVCGERYVPKTRKNRSSCPKPECKRVAQATYFSSWYEANKGHHMDVVMSARKQRERRAAAVMVVEHLRSHPAGDTKEAMARATSLRTTTVDAALELLSSAIVSDGDKVKLLAHVDIAPLIAVPKRGRKAAAPALPPPSPPTVIKRHAPVPAAPCPPAEEVTPAYMAPEHCPSPEYGTHLPGAGLVIYVTPQRRLRLEDARALHGLLSTLLDEPHDPAAPAWALVPWSEGCGWGAYLRDPAHVLKLAGKTFDGRLFDKRVRVAFGNPVRLRAPKAKAPGKYMLRLDAVTPVTVRNNGGASQVHTVPTTANLLSALTQAFPARLGMSLDARTAEIRLLARATQAETIYCGSHLGAIRGWSGSVVVEANAVGAWLLEAAGRVGLGGRTALGFGRVRVSDATHADVEAIGRVRERASIGRWFFTPHAVHRFAQRGMGWEGGDGDVLPEGLRRKAIEALAKESEAAHFVNRLAKHNDHRDVEMWRGPAPKHLRYLVGQGDGDMPALVTVLPATEERDATPATPMQRAAWPIAPGAANDYMSAVGVTPKQARRAIAYDMLHAQRVGEDGSVERWRGPEPLRAMYEVERDGSDRTVVRVRVPEAA